MTNRYDPFREMERIFNSSLRGVPASPAMPLDLYRDGDKFIAQLDLPGVEASSIDIDVEDRTLTIRAERRAVAGESLEWLTHERPTGTFARQIGLGLGVAADKIEAEYADGVLTLTIPVAEEAKPRKIQVSHGSSRQTIEAEDN